jgi:hypothetical protein
LSEVVVAAPGMWVTGHFVPYDDLKVVYSFFS